MSRSVVALLALLGTSAALGSFVKFTDLDRRGRQGDKERGRCASPRLLVSLSPPLPLSPSPPPLPLSAAPPLSLTSADQAALELAAADGKPAEAPDAKPAYVTEPLTGKVVWLAEALERRFGIATDADAREAVVALEGEDGVLHPIAKDFRGRGFHLDERLRNAPLELLVRRFEKSPVIQVVRVHTLKPEGKFELDYWCDICAIPMYELKPCECCQAETRLRERPVTTP